MNVTTASQIQTFIQRAKRAGVSDEILHARMKPEFPLSDTEKKTESVSSRLFSKFTGHSSREVERKLSELAPEIPRVERERAINASEIEIRVTLTTQTRSKWTRIQELAAHRLRFDTSYRRLIELTTDVTLESLETKKNGPIRNPVGEAPPPPTPPPPTPESTPRRDSTPSRAIPFAIRRTIWRRDQGACRYHDLESGRRCPSRFGLEIDHIIPWSHGGSSHDPANLRLLCRAHHRLVTEKTFGRIPPAVTYTASEKSDSASSSPSRSASDHRRESPASPARKPSSRPGGLRPP